MSYGISLGCCWSQTRLITNSDRAVMPTSLRAKVSHL